MELLINFINEYGTTLLYLVITAIAGWIGMWLKGQITKYLNSKEKKEVVMVVVKAVQQLYKDLGGEEKLCRAIESATQMLAEKGITITELELRMLIEAACLELKTQLLPIIDPEQHVEHELENTGMGETYIEPPVVYSPEIKEEESQALGE